MAADTKGSNGFHRLQTFEQNLLARAYGIIGFLLRLQINFWGHFGCRNQWKQWLLQCSDLRTQLTGQSLWNYSISSQASDEILKSLWLQKPLELIDSRTLQTFEQNLLDRAYGILGCLPRLQKHLKTLWLQKPKNDGFYNFQTFEQNVLVRAYGILGFLPRLHMKFWWVCGCRNQWK